MCPVVCFHPCQFLQPLRVELKKLILWILNIKAFTTFATLELLEIQELKQTVLLWTQTWTEKNSLGSLFQSTRFWFSLLIYLHRVKSSLCCNLYSLYLWTRFSKIRDTFLHLSQWQISLQGSLLSQAFFI